MGIFTRRMSFLSLSQHTVTSTEENSKHYRQRVKITHRPRPSLIHHRVPDRHGVAPFMSPLQRQYINTTNTNCYLQSTDRGKEEYLYSAILVRMHTLKALRQGSHSFTCEQRHAYLSFVSVHQMAPSQLRQQTSNCSSLLIN